MFLTSEFQNENLYMEDQFGFTKNRRTREVGFVDLEKAFDTINWKKSVT